MTRVNLLICISLIYTQYSYSQGVLTGQITSSDGSLSFVNIGVQGYNIGTFSNEEGKFRLENIPLGEQKVLFSFVGFKPQSKSMEFIVGSELLLDIVMEKSFEELEEVVITGTRTNRKKTDSPVAVGVIDKKSLENIQANTLADGLNFQSGLRMETDCQTCGYSQLRMNGLGGAYSQILIDSRPIFSSLMGLYGLEQIPVNMIERIEVVRGGGSAVYGSSAIAGTVNVITKEPTSDYLNINLSGGVINNQSFESSINASVSKVYDRAGITLNANRNDRGAYDANGDGYSELPKLEGNNFGLNTYYKVGKYSTLGFNMSSINEYRRGGNKIEEPAHKAEQSEERSHNILMGGLNFKSSMPNLNSSTSFYLAAQHTTRRHYTGIDYADAYGNTLGQTFMGGFQYNYISKSQTLTIGTEYLYDYINDEIQLYHYLIDQTTSQIGIYAQEDWEISSKFTLLAGVRMDKHNLVDHPVFNPRLNLLYKPFDFTQIRASYSSGFRAPQAFDTDLHIAFAGGGVSIITLDPLLKEETSKSYSFSMNYDRPSEKYIYGFTIDAFHTILYNALVLEENGEDDQGNMILLKKNGGGSTVRGITFEGRLNYNGFVEMTLGMTFQNSTYDEAVQWSSELEGTTDYLRTPNDYGYYTLDFTPNERIGISLSGVYTGSMLVPHFGGAPGVPNDEVIHSKTFLDQNIKLSYKMPLKSMTRWRAGVNQEIQFFGGVKNIFNSYQDDFDIGRYRDSNFVYGPARPRTIFFGIKIESF